MRTAVVTVLAVAIVAAVGGCTREAAPPGNVPTSDRTGPAAAVGAATSPAEPVPPGIVRVQGCEPTSLLPSDASTRCGQEVLAGLFSQLVALDPVTAEPTWGRADDRAVADAITTTDQQRWIIRLERGWTFHDGTPVTASSFVDAWNFAAFGPNAQANAFLFQPILGFEAMHCPTPGCEPTINTLAGLRVIDELTFQVVLTEPDRTLPRRLAHVAFSPLPPSAFEDPEAWMEAPIGNGPFRMEGSWVHEVRISLRAAPSPVAPAPGVAGVDVLLYETNEQAWQDLRTGALDVADALPLGRHDEAARRFVQVVSSGDDIAFLVVPSYRPELSEDDRLAVALSRAIDRRAIIETHLAGRARPATGLVPPVVSNHADRCGSLCDFAPETARALLAEAGLPPGGIELWFDRGGGHEAWVRAIADQWRRHLGLTSDQVTLRSLSHTAWVSHLQDRRIAGLYPLGWSMDVTSAREYLAELHGPGGLFNFDGYTGADVGRRLREAATAADDVVARTTLRELERDLLADMHHIPLWTWTHQAFHSRRVTRAVLDPKGRIQLDRLRLAES